MSLSISGGNFCKITEPQIDGGSLGATFTGPSGTYRYISVSIPQAKNCWKQRKNPGISTDPGDILRRMGDSPFVVGITMKSSHWTICVALLLPLAIRIFTKQSSFHASYPGALTPHCYSHVRPPCLSTKKIWHIQSFLILNHQPIIQPRILIEHARWRSNGL